MICSVKFSYEHYDDVKNERMTEENTSRGLRSVLISLIDENGKIRDISNKVHE